MLLLLWTGCTPEVDPTPSTITAGCIDNTEAGAHVFVCDDLVVDAYVPEGCDQGGCGVIVDVHGAAMSGVQQEANTELSRLAVDHIVLQPNATPAAPASRWEADADDPRVYDALMQVAEVFEVDRDRLHMTGFSQGGYMSWRFDCAYPDVLASVAPMAACGGDIGWDCDQFDEPIDVLFMHGTADARVSYDCAEPRRDAVISSFGLGPEVVVSEDESHRWSRFTSEQATLEFIQHDYTSPIAFLGGHCFPGSTDPGGAEGQLVPMGCEGESAFHWGEAILAFVGEVEARE